MRLRVTNKGFKTFRTNVEVTVGGSATLDAQLEIGESTTVVEVVSGRATEVNTQTQEMSQLVDRQQMAQLPSLTRNAYDFVSLSGNVSNGDSTSVSQGNNNVSGSGQSLTTRGVSFSLNGQRQTGTEILLDGVENVAVYSYAVGENVPIDSVQEYSVITNNFSAEYGRASGGVVNVTTKAGTNQIPRLRVGIQSPGSLYGQHLRQRCGRSPQGPVHSQSVWLPGRRPYPQEQAVYLPKYGMDAGTKSGKFESGSA